MYREFRATLTRLILLAATGSLLTSCTESKPQPRETGITLTTLPEDWAIEEHAPTLAELISQTKPSLQFDLGANGTMLVWTGKATSGVRYFRLATARRYAPKDGSAQWILMRMDGGMLEWGEGTLPKTTIVVENGPPGVRTRMGTANWARLVAAEPAYGSLYELEFYFNSAAEAARGRRLLLLEDSTGQWQRVASLDGSYWDDTGWLEESTVRTRWTGNSAAPLELTINWTGSIEDDHDNLSGLRIVWGTERHYAGPLPFAEPSSLVHFITIQSGQTFNELTARMVYEETPGESEDLRRKATQALRAALLHLNAGMDPSRLRAGQKVMVPDMKTRQAMFKGAGGNN